MSDMDTFDLARQITDAWLEVAEADRGEPRAEKIETAVGLLWTLQERAHEAETALEVVRRG